MLEMKENINQIRKLNTELKKEGFLNLKYYLVHTQKLVISLFPEHDIRQEKMDDIMCSIEASYNGKKSRIYTSDLEDVRDIIRLMKETSEVYGEVVQIYRRYSPCENKEKEFVWDCQDKIRVVLENTMKQVKDSEGIHYIPRCSYEQNSREIWMIDEQMNKIQERDGYHCFSLLVAAQKDGKKSSVSDCAYGKSLCQIDVEGCVERVVKEVEKSFGGEKLISGKYPAIFCGKVVAELLEAFLPAFYADNIQENKSSLNKKQNTQVTSKKLWIKEIPEFQKGRNMRTVDDEGVPVTEKTIIKDGKFVQLLYNMKSAKKDGLKSTGNGFCSSVKEEVGTGITNIVLGMDYGYTDTRSGVEKEMREGILVTRVDGVFAGADSRSGDFSLIAGGRVIRDGEEQETFREVTISGNFFEILRRVKKSGNQLYITDPGGMSVLAPDLWIEFVTVSGK